MPLKKQDTNDEAGGVKELLVLALPMFISTACDTAMTFTDRLFLARVGSEQMNAALAGGTSFQMMIFFFAGLIGYSTALVAQYLGAREKQNSSKATFQAILIAFIAWPIILSIEPLALRFFDFMHTPESQKVYQTQYLHILAWGSIFGLLRHAMACFFTGVGKTKIVMIATLGALAVNVALDYLLIFGKFGFPAMGIQGAAIATVGGTLFSLTILLFAYFNRTNRIVFSIGKSFRFDKRITKKLLYYGSPAGLEMFLNMVAFSIMIFLFHSQGDVAATASTIMFNWDMVSFIPLIGVEIAITSLVGRYMGAGKPELAQRAAFSGIKIGAIYSILVFILFMVFPQELVLVFRPQEQSEIFNNAIPIASRMIQFAAIYVLSEAIMLSIIGALRGAGDTYFTMIVSVVGHWILVPVLYLALNVFHLSIPISWLFIVIFFVLFAVVLVLRFRSGKWKTIKVI